MAQQLSQEHTWSTPMITLLPVSLFNVQARINAYYDLTYHTTPFKSNESNSKNAIITRRTVWRSRN